MLFFLCNLPVPQYERPKPLSDSNIYSFLFYYLTHGQSKLEKVEDPCSGHRGPLPEIRVHYLNLNFQETPLVETFLIFITGGVLL